MFGYVSLEIRDVLPKLINLRTISIEVMCKALKPHAIIAVSVRERDGPGAQP